MKLEVVRLGGDITTATDTWLHAKACKAVDQCMPFLAGERKARPLRSGDPVLREALRYDTSLNSDEGLFRKHWLSLAIEATAERTKLKCKHHSLIPELLYATPDESICFPATVDGRHTKARFKVEQDIHFSNVKTCASGSVFVPGRLTEVADVAFFSTHFPRLTGLCTPETRLHTVHHWREMVHETGEIFLGKTRLSNLMLVTRRDPASGALVESELSYKVRKEMGRDWDQEELKAASRLYSELHATGAFQEDPPIFYVFDPVASVDIRRV